MTHGNGGHGSMKVSDAEFKLLSEQALWGSLIQIRSPYRLRDYEVIGLMSNAMLLIASIVADADET